MQLTEHEDMIRKVSERAVQEFQIEKTLEAMRGELRRAELTLKPHLDTHMLCATESANVASLPRSRSPR